MILSPALLSPAATAVAVGTYVLAALWPRTHQSTAPERTSALDAPWYLLAVGWLAHALALVSDAFDWAAPAWQARFGFAPAMSATLWLVLAVYAAERMQLPSHMVRRALAGLAAATVALAWLFPGQAHPQMGHGLAPLHWVLGLASYGLFGAALLHAVFLRLAERRMRHGATNAMLDAPGIPLLRLESLTLRFVLAGFVVLSLTLVLGAIFAQPWRWDHKSVLSIMAWVVFAILLVGRHWLGWRGRTAINWLYAGSTLLLLAYVGSRFVFEVLLQRPTGTP